MDTIKLLKKGKWEYNSAKYLLCEQSSFWMKLEINCIYKRYMLFIYQVLTAYMYQFQ